MGVSICGHCQGPVDVAQMHGASVRCGCGKTQLAMPKAPGLRDVNAELKTLLRILTAHRVQTYRSGQCEITLSPDAWRAEPEAKPAAQPPPEDVVEMCTCGHAIHDHTQAGCTMGCAIDTCGLPGEEKAA